MTITVLPLSNGGCSLEFGPDEIDAVRQAIFDLFGEATKKVYATFDRVSFGKEFFLFQNEWDEPCRIAGTEVGGGMLMQIAQRLFDAKS